MTNRKKTTALVLCSFLFLLVSCQKEKEVGNAEKFQTGENLVVPEGVDLDLHLQSVLEEIRMPGFFYSLVYAGNKHNAFLKDTLNTSGFNKKGWGIGIHHAYDAHNKTLYLGDGKVQAVKETLSSPSLKDGSILVASNSGKHFFQFDAQGRHEKTIDAITLNELHKFTYDKEGRLTLIENSLGQKHQVKYPDENTAELVVSGRRRAFLTENDNGKELWIEIAGGKPLHCFYEQNKLVKMQRIKQYDKRYQYDENGLIESIKQRNGAITFKTSGPADDRLITKLEKRGGKERETSVRMTKEGNQVKVAQTFYDGSKVQALFESGYLKEYINKEGAKSAYTWETVPVIGTKFAKSVSVNKPGADPMSWQQTVAAEFTNNDPLRLEKYSSELVNESGKIAFLSEPGKNRYSINSGPDEIAYIINKRNQIVEEKRSGLAATKYYYDAQGKLTSVTQVGSKSNRTSKVSYDIPAQRVNITNPIGEVVSLDYNQFGQINRAKFSNGKTLGMDYLCPGGLVNFRTPGGSAHRIIRDAFDEEKMYISPEGKQIPRETAPGSKVASTADEKDIVRQNDAGGNLKSIQVKNNPAIAYATGPAGFSKVGKAQVEKHKKFSAIGKVVIGALEEDRDYNEFGELVQYSVRHKDRDLYKVTYKRDGLGRISETSENFGEGTGDKVKTYHYDVMGYLLEVRENGRVAEKYTYDGNGNRIVSQNSLLTAKASFNKDDQIQSFGDAPYNFSPTGYLSGKSGEAYDYDKYGNLVAVTLASGEKIEYVTDSKHRRTAKKIDGDIVRQYRYAGNQLIAELDGQGNLLHQFVYGIDERVPLYIESPKGTFKSVVDHVGSPLMWVNVESGEVAQEISYDTFGNMTANSDPDFQSLGFAAGLYDNHTKLTRFGARDYDPEIGRWTAMDPLLFGGGQPNLYVYANNDPINRIDPSGLQSITGYPNLDWFIKKTFGILFASAASGYLGLPALPAYLLDFVLPGTALFEASFGMLIGSMMMYFWVFLVSGAILYAAVELGTVLGEWLAGLGDPHMVTIDGRRFDFQAVGEFTVIKARDDSFELQARQRALGHQVSANDAVAMRFGKDRIELYRENDLLVINGKEQPGFQGERLLGDGTRICQSREHTYSIKSAMGIEVEVDIHGSFLDYQLGLSENWKGKTVGLLGHYDGNQNNEFITRSGKELTLPQLLVKKDRETFHDVLYHQFGDSWRITDATSLFTYAPGTSTATYTDRDYPKTLTSIADLTEDQRNQAREICLSAGVKSGAALENCILDVALTEDKDFARPFYPMVASENPFQEGEELPLEPEETGESVKKEAFHFTTFNPEDFNIGGTAKIDSGIIKIDQDASDYARSLLGWAMLKDTLGYTDHFETAFEFSVHKKSTDSGDGFALLMGRRNDGAGLVNKDCSFEHIPGTLVVEFDTKADPYDVSGTHFTIHSGAKRAGCNDLENGLGTNMVKGFDDGKKHRVRITYENPSMKIYYDGAEKPVVEAEVNLSELIDFSAGDFFLGFNGSSRKETPSEEYHIYNWSYQNLEPALEDQ